MRRSAWFGSRGRQRIRVRDEYVRDVVAPLLSQSAAGAVKLDLVLRGLASLDREDPGAIPYEISWAQLHGFCRGRTRYQGETRLQRRWVNEQLERLEDLDLVSRDRSTKTRPRLRVLSDRRDRRAFDDPGAQGDQYVTVLGELVEFDHLGHWGAPEIAAYLAAMNAERHTRAQPDLMKALGLDELPFGGGRWFRPLSWFADAGDTRPEWHIRYPFSERTLRRGLGSLASKGMLQVERVSRDPRTGRRFEGGTRLLYHNGFDDLRKTPEYRSERLRKRRRLWVLAESPVPQPSPDPFDPAIGPPHGAP